MKQRTMLILTVIALLLLAGGVQAQSGGGYDIQRHVFATAGDGFATGTGYQLGYTVGQTVDPIIMSGTGYQLSVGFWFGAGGGPTEKGIYLPIIRKS